MVVYWSACLASFAFTWFATQVKHDKEGIGYWFLVTFVSAFPLIFISAIRFNVGADYISYYTYYLGILNGAGQGRFEVLYYLANKLVASFHLSAPWLFGFTASLFLMPIYKRIISDSPYMYMSIFLLLGMTYFFYFLNGTRQMIGAAFLLVSIPYIEKRKFIPFLLLVLIASGFHITCIVFIAVYFLVYMDLNPRLLAVITLAIFVFGQFFANIANNILSGMDYYSTYLESKYAQKGQGYVVLAMNILLVVFATFLYQRNNSKFKIYYNLQVVALWASALTGRIVLIDRYRMVFGLASIILVPMTLNEIENKYTRIICSVAVVTLYFVYSMYTVGIQNSNVVLPYQTIF